MFSSAVARDSDCGIQRALTEDPVSEDPVPEDPAAPALSPASFAIRCCAAGLSSATHSPPSAAKLFCGAK